MPDLHETQLHQQEMRQRIEQREKELDEALSNLQIVYADMKYRRSERDQTFVTFLDQHTEQIERVRQAIRDMHEIAEGQREGFVTTEMQPLLEVLQKIYDERATDWSVMFQRTIKEWVERFPRKNQQRPEFPHVGLLEYVSSDYVKRGELIAGVEEGDPVMEIHVRAAYKQPDTQLGPKELVDSFRQLANVIIREHPETVAIGGWSWLMDTPLAKRLGFRISDGGTSARRLGMSTWSQFIDRDGALAEARVKKLMETGEFPYVSKRGVMLVEEFLRRYVPDEYRNEPIVLKRTKQEWRDERSLVHDVGSRLVTEWDQLTSISSFLEEESAFSQLLERMNLKQDFIRLMQHLKDQRISLEAARQDEAVIVLFGRLTSAMEKDRFEEYTITIPKKDV